MDSEDDDPDEKHLAVQVLGDFEILFDGISGFSGLYYKAGEVIVAGTVSKPSMEPYLVALDSVTRLCFNTPGNVMESKLGRKTGDSPNGRRFLND